MIKKCILDVKLEMNHSTIINIEIQSVYQSFWPERSLTYLCRMFDHLKEGQGYSDLKPCIQIGILENDIFKSDDPRYTGDFYSEYQILHMKKHTGYCGKFKICELSAENLEDFSVEIQRILLRYGNRITFMQISRRLRNMGCWE